MKMQTKASFDDNDGTNPTWSKFSSKKTPELVTSYFSFDPGLLILSSNFNMSDDSNSTERVAATPNLSGIPIPRSVVTQILINKDSQLVAKDGNVEIHEAILRHYCPGLFGNTKDLAKALLKKTPTQIIEAFRELLYGGTPAHVLRNRDTIFSVMSVAIALETEAVTELCLEYFDSLEINEVTVKDILNGFCAAHTFKVQRLKESAIKLLKQVPEDQLKTSDDLKVFLQDITMAVELIHILCK